MSSMIKFSYFEVFDKLNNKLPCVNEAFFFLFVLFFFFFWGGGWVGGGHESQGINDNNITEGT